MQFQVPQFIEVEDKIFGPLTFKQFLYLLGGGGISFVIWKSLPIFLAVLLIAPIVGLSLALAFYKNNNRPFIGMLESMFKYSVGGKLYVWKKEPKKLETQADVAEKGAESLYIPKLSDSKLKDIAWSLGVKDSVYNDQISNNK